MEESNNIALKSPSQTEFSRSRGSTAASTTSHFMFAMQMPQSNEKDKDREKERVTEKEKVKNNGHGLMLTRERMSTSDLTRDLNASKGHATNTQKVVFYGRHSTICNDEDHYRSKARQSRSNSTEHKAKAMHFYDANTDREMNTSVVNSIAVSKCDEGPSNHVIPVGRIKCEHAHASTMPNAAQVKHVQLQPPSTRKGSTVWSKSLVLLDSTKTAACC